MIYKPFAKNAISALALLFFTAGLAPSQIHKPYRVMQVEVAQDATRFAFDEDPVFDSGLPGYGNPFVIQGYIYPAGALAGSANGGTNPDGSPEFPEMVIGEWTCWGHMIGNGVETTSGQWVISTQVFSFAEDVGYGTESFVSAGYETVDGTVERAVTGGTGSFLTATGVQRQQIMGNNAAGGLILSEEITLYRIAK